MLIEQTFEHFRELCFVKDDQRWSHCRHRSVHLTSAHHILQFFAKVLEKGVGCIRQKLEHVVREFRCSCPIDDDVADTQDLQQESVANVVVLGETKTTFGIEDECLGGLVERRPYAHGARFWGRWSVELLLSVEEDLVECKGLSVPSVSDDGDTLDCGIVWWRLQLTNEFCLTIDLIENKTDRTHVMRNDKSGNDRSNKRQVGFPVVQIISGRNVRWVVRRHQLAAALHSLPNGACSLDSRSASSVHWSWFAVVRGWHWGWALEQRFWFRWWNDLRPSIRCDAHHIRPIVYRRTNQCRRRLSRHVARPYEPAASLKREQDKLRRSRFS